MKTPSTGKSSIRSMKYSLYLISLVIWIPTEVISAQQPISTQGEKLFIGYCSRCHGIGGTGGEGPSLQGRQFTRATEESDLAKLVLTGISGTVMSRTWVTRDEANQIASYVWSLARVDDQPVEGDPLSGSEIFSGIGGCASCHIINGKGVGIGPDLSNVGARRGIPFLRESVVAPGISIPKGERGSHSNFLAVRVEMDDGRKMRGMRINEDAFILNLRDTEGRYYMLQKSHMNKLTREFGESIMPGYGSTLNSEQITNLVAYMASLR
jgi:putative heme-binding domain-containing protein|tara:strand:- start:112 stop:912 length:801 start_codon:yes stop_codon:yes gene_type:complete